MAQEHPFAQFIRIVGRGRHGARPLTQEEAFQAMTMILRGDAEPEQIGAFLMLIRIREETPEELTGFVLAARNYINSPHNAPNVQLDWSSYAGKRRHLPWFVLSAVLLAEMGITVFMHGFTGRTDNRIYTPTAIRALGLPLCLSLEDASAELHERKFAFLALENLCPPLQKMIELRDKLGLRSPINSVVRMLNPLKATHILQGIFHPTYKDIHLRAGLLLQEPHLAVLKGEGGEAERNPDSASEVATLYQCVTDSEQWPPLFAKRHLKDESMDVSRLAAVWRGESEDKYGVGAIVGTAAIALKLLGYAKDISNAQKQAESLWLSRPKEKYPLA